MNVFTRFFLSRADATEVAVSAYRFLALAVIFDGSLGFRNRMSHVKHVFNPFLSEEKVNASVDSADIPF